MTAERRPDPPDQEAWEEAATTALIGQFDAIRANADRWSATVAGLLGVLSTVTVFAGIDTLADLPENARPYLVGATLVAGILLAVSVIQSARAAQGTSKVMENFDGNGYRAYVTSAAEAAIPRLKGARWTAIIAAGVVFVVGAYGLIAAAGTDTPTKVFVLVVTTEGAARCGQLATGADGAVTVGGSAVSGVQTLQTVAHC